jgi:hypothetical protein
VEITFTLSLSVTYPRMLGLGFANDQVVVPERQDDIHLAIVRLLRPIRDGPPQCTCGPELGSFS